MSIESENNFINELKVDILKDKVKAFIFKYSTHLIVLVTIIFLFTLLFIFTSVYKNNKLENYNNKIYAAIDGDNKIEELEKIYNDKSAPRISKTFAALALVDLYTATDLKINVLEEIYENEKDLFFKYYAGLAMLSIEISQEEMDKDHIESLIKGLENKENPLKALSEEQKALYLIKIGKKEEANELLNKLLNSNESEEFKNRIKIYLQNEESL